MTLDDFHVEKAGELDKIESTDEAYCCEQNAEVLLNKEQLCCFFMCNSVCLRCSVC